MRTKVKNSLPVILFLIAVSIVVISFFSFILWSYNLVYVLSCLTVLVFQLQKKPDAYQITLALLFFLFAEVCNLLVGFTALSIIYELLNVFCILAYASIVHFISQRLSVKKVVMKLSYVLLIPVLFGVYLMYYLTDIVFMWSHGEYSFRFVIETLYNFVVLMVFVLSFINFVYYDSKKELLLFLSCTSLAFFEIIQFLTIYVFKSSFLFVTLSVLKLLGFLLLYYYVTLKKENNKIYNLLD